MTDLTPDSNGRIGLEGIVQVLADGHEIGQRANFFPTEGRVLEDSEDGTIYLGDGTQWLTVGDGSGLTTPSIDVSESTSLNGLDVAGSASADSLDVSGAASADSLDVSGSASIDGTIGTRTGVTELGNEVVPSGSIQTGPIEVPADHPNYPMANLPVTDDLSAGEQVGYHLAINQDKALTLEAEADGNGGIQNANVSFENTQIADPAHNTSADSMTADPESASEDGFVEVDINGTTYQVPMYQA